MSGSRKSPCLRRRLFDSGEDGPEDSSLSRTDSSRRVRCGLHRLARVDDMDYQDDLDSQYDMDDTIVSEYQPVALSPGDDYKGMSYEELMSLAFPPSPDLEDDDDDECDVTLQSHQDTPRRGRQGRPSSQWRPPTPHRDDRGRRSPSPDATGRRPDTPRPRRRRASDDDSDEFDALYDSTARMLSPGSTLSSQDLDDDYEGDVTLQTAQTPPRRGGQERRNQSRHSDRRNRLWRPPTPHRDGGRRSPSPRSRDHHAATASHSTSRFAPALSSTLRTPGDTSMDEDISMVAAGARFEPRHTSSPERAGSYQNMADISPIRLSGPAFNRSVTNTVLSDREYAQREADFNEFYRLELERLRSRGSLAWREGCF